MAKINVMIVDDSAVVRQVLKDIINAQPNMKVCSSAQDPIFAARHMEKIWPDVIILDIEMPRMDGLSFLKKLMAERPTPVVMCSTLTEKGATTSLQALALGAVEIVTKPKVGVKGFLSESAKTIVQAIKTAASVNIKRVGAKTHNLPVAEPARKLTADAMLSAPSAKTILKTTERIIAIGTSTGGTIALERILPRLPKLSPGIVIVQHMPVTFTGPFARRLNNLCKVEVKEAQGGETILPGHVYIAPGDKHMLINPSGSQYKIEIKDGPLVSRHKPSVDVLFRSAARYAGSNAMGIILTGMGDDGANGLLEMKQAGSLTLAENEASCIVHGMPKEALKKGGVVQELSLEQFPEAMLDFHSSGFRKAY